MLREQPPKSRHTSTEFRILFGSLELFHKSAPGLFPNEHLFTCAVFVAPDAELRCRRVKLSTKVTVPTAKWDNANQRIKTGTSKDLIAKQTELDNSIKAIVNLHNQLVVLDGLEFTVDSLRDGVKRMRQGKVGVAAVVDWRMALPASTAARMAVTRNVCMPAMISRASSAKSTHRCLTAIWKTKEGPRPSHAMRISDFSSLHDGLH